MTERVSTVLIGGPCDGYNGIDVHPDEPKIIPWGHHRRDCGCKGLRVPIYKRKRPGAYEFIGYLRVVLERIKP